MCSPWKWPWNSGPSLGPRIFPIHCNAPPIRTAASGVPGLSPAIAWMKSFHASSAPTSSRTSSAELLGSSTPVIEPRGKLLRLVPMHPRGDIEVAKIVVPGFHGVRRNQRIPMQFVDGKTCMIDGRRNKGKADILQPRLRAELQPIEAHIDAAFHASSQRIGHEVRQHYSLRIQNVARPAGQIRSVE